MTHSVRQPLLILSDHFLCRVARRLDLSTEAGRASARLLLAVELGRTMETADLIRVCRESGVQHVCAGHQAAHALAALAIPVLPDVEGRH